MWSYCWTSDFTGSHAYTAWMYNIAQSGALPQLFGTPPSWYWQRFSNIPKAASVPMFIDGAWCDTWPHHAVARTELGLSADSFT